MSWARTVVHADMDAFYASVEQLDNAELIGKPILVGPKSRRGVVLTASYEARPFHVGSAMPMAEALRRCPHAIVVPPRFERYTELSSRIMAVFRDFSPEVEAISLDEAFLEMTGTEHLFGPPETMGAAIKQSVLEATGLHVSVGVAASKYVAKVASGICKPRGLLVIAPEETVGWLAKLPVARLWGAGPKTQARLEQFGYQTIGDIAAADPVLLREQLGQAGGHFYELAHGRDPRRVEGSRRNRSMGSERTLNNDVVAREDIVRHLQRSADRIARRLRKKSLLAGGVRVRLKTTDFKLLSRQCTLAAPSDVADVLLQAGISLLERFEHPGPFRLVGLTAHDLRAREGSAQLDLLTDDRERRLETTLDELSERFGDNIVRRARDLGASTVMNEAPNRDGLTED
ncbi:MAG: DNA polymerase IV [Pseudomonadota bacterium]